MNEFLDSIAAYLQVAQSNLMTTMTNQDYLFAMNIRMKELELANQTKVSRLSHVEQAIHKLQEAMTPIELRTV